LLPMQEYLYWSNTARRLNQRATSRMQKSRGQPYTTAQNLGFDPFNEIVMMRLKLD